MGWTPRYKKEKCTAAKDVSFSAIESNCKLKVPAMVISEFTKKVGVAASVFEKKKAAVPPFDVFVEFDSTSNTGRIVVKKLGSDFEVKWVDRSGPGPDAVKALLKVKAELTSLANTNQNYLKEIEAVKSKVKELKEEVKALAESGTYFAMYDPAEMKKRVAEKKAAITLAYKKGDAVHKEHGDWYLAGPRAGIAPILKKCGMNPQALPAAEADQFAKALHAMSGAANEVKKIWDVDIRTATDALITRLNNLEVTTTKKHAEALAEVRKTLTAEVAKVRELMAKGDVEMKLPKTTELIVQLKDPNSAAYKRLTANPSNIQVEMESNKTRLANIPKYAEMVTKQVSRLKKGIPVELEDDPEIKKTAAVLDQLAAENIKNLRAGQALIERCDAALVAFRAKK